MKNKLKDDCTRIISALVDRLEIERFELQEEFKENGII